MRVAVISDIHSNLPALEAVLADIDSEQLDEVWCLGDIVGYGAQPNECCARTREVVDFCLCGNHDLAVLGALDIRAFSGDAAAAAKWTRRMLSEEHAKWLSQLAPTASRPTVQMFHGSPRDPVWDYVLSEHVAEETFSLTTAPLVLVGHSHVALALVYENDAVDGGVAPGGTRIELDSGRRLLNPGSTGQPRDGDARAAWLLLEHDAARATFRRVSYDVEAAQAAIRAASLPEALAARLAHGI